MKFSVTMFYFISLLSLTSLAYGSPLTCSGAKPSKEKSILDKGQKLAHFEVQDQDGMGTCYANSAAALLEASLAGHPKVSYQQIAVNYATSGKPTAKAMKESKGKSKFLSEGGSTCGSFNATKKKGYLCHRDDVPLERRDGDQKKVIHALGKFYDQYQLLKLGGKSTSIPYTPTVVSSNKKLADAMKNNLKEIVASLRENSHKKDCQFPRQKPMPTSLKEELEDQCIDRHTELTNKIQEVEDYKKAIDALKKKKEVRVRARHMRSRDFIALQKVNKMTRTLGIIALEQKIKFSQIDIKSLSEDIAKFGKITVVEKDLGIFSFLKKKMKSTISCELNETLKKNMIDSYYRDLEKNKGQVPSMKALLSSFEAKNSLPIGSISSGSEKSLKNIYKNDLNYANEDWCKENKEATALLDASQIQAAVADATNMCISKKMASSLGSSLSQFSLLSQSSLPTNTILDAVSKLDSSVDDFLLGVIGPDCFKNKRRPDGARSRISIPSNFLCKDILFPPKGKEVRKKERGKTVIDKEKTYALQYQEAKKIMRKEIGRFLGDYGQPVSIGVCTSFFKNKNARSKFGTECTATGQHGFHAMTITGYKCVKGKISYQIQNSWGTGCGAVTPPGAKKPLYECDSKQGNFWIPEEVLLPNTKRLSYLYTKTKRK